MFRPEGSELSTSRPRPIVLLTVLLGVLALLAGWAGGGDRSSGGGTPGGSGGAFPATIPTAFGDVIVPHAPKRVVALGWSDAETALALGVQPVGTKERHDQLAQLGVPVVEIPAGGENYLTAWQDQLRMIGAALGKQPEAARLQADLEGRFATARAQHPQLNRATVVSGAKNTLGEYAAYIGRTGRVQFLRDLGLVNSEAIERLPSQSFSAPISRERMGLLDARVTIMRAISGNATDITADPLWATVPSVAAGRGVVLDDKNVSLAFASASVPGQIYALDRMVGPIATAVAKP